MYYGKQIHENGQISYISSSGPLPYSDILIQLTEDEFNTIWNDEIKPRDIKKGRDRMAKKRKEQIENIYKEEITTPNQEILVKEKDLEDVEAEGEE